MIVPLVTVWAAAGHDPATVGITGLGLATYAWAFSQLGQVPADARHTPPRHHTAVIADSRKHHGRPRTLRWADLWAASADTPTPAPSRGEGLRFVVALTSLFDHPAPAPAESPEAA